MHLRRSGLDYVMGDIFRRLSLVFNEHFYSFPILFSISIFKLGQRFIYTHLKVFLCRFLQTIHFVPLIFILTFICAYFIFNILFHKAISDSYVLSNLRCHPYLIVMSNGNTVSGYTFMCNLHDFFSKQITRYMYIYVSPIVNTTVPVSVPYPLLK